MKRVFSSALILGAIGLSVVGSVALRAQASAPQLYMLPNVEKFAVPRAFHLASCERMKPFQMHPIKAIDIVDTEMPSCEVCKPLSVPGVAELIRNTPSQRVTFVSAPPLPMRADARATAKIVGQLGAGDLALLYQTEAGWARVSSFADKAKPPVIGWVKATGENLVAREYLGAIGAWIRGQEGKWPGPIRAAVIKGDVRVGFTVAQLEASQGDSTATAVEETAAGKVEVRSYPGKTVTVVGGRVTRVLTIK